MPNTIRAPEPGTRKRRARARSAALVLTCGWLPLSLAAGLDDWRIASDAPGAQELRFRLSWEGEALSGRFRRFDGSIRFDPERPAAARFDVRVALASVDLGNADLDEAVADPLWFDSKRYAAAVYRGRGAVRLGDGRFRMVGDLALKGRRRPVDLLFHWDRSGGGARLSGEAWLDRREFGVGGGEWLEDPTVSYEIQVSFDLDPIPAGAGRATR